MAEQYKALTRKYRPVNFEDIVSQEHVSSTLKNAIEQNRINHAYLFCGPRGVGKTTMARVLARNLNSVDASIDGEALNNTLNIIEIDAASNNKVEDVHALRERVRIRPQNGRFKVYIIDEVHMLSKAAFNALLKTLEEPPDHAIFIFATTEPHKILPTILSRCQRFDFRRIRVEEIVDRLRTICGTENITIDDESLHVIAKKADGSLRDALGIMDQAIAFCGSDINRQEMFSALNVVSGDRMFELMESVDKKDANAGITLIHDLLQEGYDIQEFLSTLTGHLRNLYLARDAKNMHLIEDSEETKQRYRQAATTFEADDLMRMLHIINEAQFRIREARQPRVHLEIAILKLIHLERIGGLQKLVQELQELKEGNATAPPRPETPASGTTGAKPGHSSDQPPLTQGKASEEVNLFGKPSLKRTQNTLSTVDLGSVATETADDEYRGEITGNLALAPKPRPTAPLYLHDVRQLWDTYLKEVYEKMEKVCYFTLQRVTLVDLDQGKLSLECQDAFTCETVEENKREFSRLFNQLTGHKLRFHATVKQTIGTTETLDPYTRFKALQKKDPTLRTIVELFGAELEY
ncbi:MAG: DNA polymerase III subunit gamma/tau [Balneolales bacterium]